MKPLEQLKNEHGTVKEMLGILRAVAHKLESGQRVEARHLDSIIEFLRVFVDKCHHGKEENALLPALAEAGIPSTESLIDTIVTDHELARAWVESMSEGIEDYKKAKASAGPKIIENIRYYLSLLGEHIKKEDYALFPMADLVLDPQSERSLMEAFRRIEVQAIGTGKHKKLEGNLRRLKEVFPAEDRA